MFKNTCTASRVMIPTMVRAPNLSRALRASQYPRRISRANRTSTTSPPTKPSSSTTMGNTKSFSGSGIYSIFWMLFPSPRPSIPPEPMAMRDCTV